MQVEHAGSRAYYFSTDSHDDDEEWIRAMREAAKVNAQRTNLGTIAGLSHTIMTKAPDSQTQQDPHTQGNSDNHSNIKRVGSLTKETSSTPSYDKEGGKNCRKQGEGPEAGEDEGERPGITPELNHHSDGMDNFGPPNTMSHNSKPSLSRSHSGHCTHGHTEVSVRPSRDPRTTQPESVVLRRGFVPRTAPERVAQRKNSMAQLQQWVSQRRGMSSGINSPCHYNPLNRGVSGTFYGYGYSSGPHYVDYNSLYPQGVRPESICSVSTVGRQSNTHWTVEDKRHSLRAGQLYGHMHQDICGPQNYSGMETPIKRLSIQPRSRSVPRSPSSSSEGPYSPVPPNFASQVQSSTGFEQLPWLMRENTIHADSSVHRLRRSFSSPKYGDRRSLGQGLYPHNYPASPSIHDKMEDILDIQLQRKLDYLDQQVPPFHDVYCRELHPTLKINEIETSKLLGRLCEQNQILKDQEAVVHRLRIDKDILEEALVTTHEEMELYHNQPVIIEKLQFKKETQQNQLINIRGELSQASSVLTTTRMEFEALEDEANAIHGDLWEQLNSGGQSELVHRHIQKEFWRVQDVLEGLHKKNSSRGTDTVMQRVTRGALDSFCTNSPVSPLSSVSLTGPLSSFSPVSGCQASPIKQLGLEAKFGEQIRVSDLQEQVQDRQSTTNKVGIVPPRTKFHTDESHRSSAGVTQHNGRVLNGVSKERPKSAVFPAEMKSKMTAEEQNERIRRNKFSSVREQGRSLNLAGGQSPANYKVVRRRLTAHEIDIKDLETAVRGQGQESPQEEIARLRRSQVEQQRYDISKNMVPEEVLIPGGYLELEDNIPLGPDEQREKQKKVERIKSLIAKSNLQNMVPLLDGPMEDGAPCSSQQQLQEQEKLIEISCALAAEASRRSRLLSVRCTYSPPPSPTSLVPNPSSVDFPNSASIMKV